MQNNWMEAVLTHIDRASSRYEYTLPCAPYSDICKLRGTVIDELLEQFFDKNEGYSIEKMSSLIKSKDVNEYKKNEFNDCMKSVVKRLQSHENIELVCRTILNVSGITNLFDMFEDSIKYKTTEDKIDYDVLSVKQWHENMIREMHNFISDSEYIPTILKFAVRVKSPKKKTEINYIDIYEIIEKNI